MDEETFRDSIAHWKDEGSLVCRLSPRYIFGGLGLRVAALASLPPMCAIHRSYGGMCRTSPLTAR